MFLFASFNYLPMPNNSYFLKELAKVENTCESELKKINISISGSGGSCMSDIKVVHFCGQTYGDYNIDGARILFIKAYETIRKEFNGNVFIRPYLRKYPITEEVVTFSLAIDTNQFEVPEMSKPGMITYNRNSISYSGYDKEKECYVKIFKESYAEAYKKVFNHN
jgi:hypothetical protein